MLENRPIIGTTNVIFKTFEPITFPTTMSVFFLITALIVAANSGKLVPIAMMVNPITVSYTHLTLPTILHV